MGETHFWFANYYSTSSQETHSTPSLCEDFSFNSLSGSNSSMSHHCIASFRTSISQINCLAIHKQNNTLYVASSNEINVFDLTGYNLIDTFGSGSGSVKSIAFGGEDNRIFTSHQDCKIRVWQMVVSKTNSTKHQQISSLPHRQNAEIPGAEKLCSSS